MLFKEDWLTHQYVCVLSPLPPSYIVDVMAGASEIDCDHEAILRMETAG